MTLSLDTFDDFIDDLLSSDIDLLKGELDFLLMQHIFQSINLDSLKDTEFNDKDYLAAWLILWNFYMKNFGHLFSGVFYLNLFL